MRLHWTTWFDRATIDRARTYAADGSVHPLQTTIKGDAVLVDAQVDGERTYHPRIVVQMPRLDPAGGQGLHVRHLEGACTCPVGFHCKHIAAILMVWSRMLQTTGIDLGQDEAASDAAEPRDERGHRREPRPLLAGQHRPADPVPSGFPDPGLAVAHQGDDLGREVQEWLTQVQRLTTSNQPEPSTTAERILWKLLRLSDPDDVPLYAVLPALSRRLKSGRWSPIRPYSSLSSFVQRPPAGITTAELALARQLDRLAASAHRFRQQTGILHHSSGATGDLVGRLVRSGTLHVPGPTDGLAGEGPPRQGRLAWSVVPGGRRLIVVGDDGRPVQLIASDPPWYIDGLTIGPAHLPCTPAQLDLVLSMPTVAEEHLAAIDLKTALPAAPPPPVDQRPGVPEPHLVVWDDVVEDHRNWPWQTLPATLCVPYFRYGQAKVIPDGGLIVRHDGVRLVRDAAAELRWMEQLGKLGLTSLPNGVEVRGRRRPPMRPLTAVPPRRHHEQRIELPAGLLTTLSAAGWRIERDGVVQAEPDVVEAIDTRLEAIHEHGRDWFQLHLGVTLGDQAVDLIPLIAPLAVERSRFDALPTVQRDGRTWVLLTIDDRRVLRIPKDLLATLLENLVELFDQGGTGQPRIAADDLGLLHDLGHTDPRWLGDAKMRALVERLRGCLDPPPVPTPAGFTATLRPYQLQGLAWMQHLRRVDLGGVLADDMGLGKTVQAIAHLATEHAAGRLDRPALIVCPASMIGTWQRELARFAPGLTVRLLHGQDRPRSAGDLTGFHLLITTYATLLRDAEWLADLPLHLVLCDEAQALKNAAAKAGDAVRRLATRHRLALTGTPIENHLGEMFSLVDWLAPGLLGRRARFDRIFRMPIEKQGDGQRLALLRRRLAPVVLRRTKEAVAPELPAKTEQVLSIPLGEQQRALYESVRAAMAVEVRKLLTAKGLRKGRLEILEALLRLRQVCCDPRLIKTGTARRCAESAKLDTLVDMLPELVEEGRRILLFSQFTGMLDLIESEVLAKAGLHWVRLDGSTPAQKRATLVEQFQQGKTHLFLISLKAGGTGLTLTAADTVIHYDPWWNPAVEDQATDRAHRIGQDKPVNVYRLVITGSIEERIQQLQRGKRALAEGLFDGTGQLSGGIDEAVLDELLQPLE